MFFRKNPFNGGFSILAGNETLLDALTSFRFEEEDINYLREQKTIKFVVISNLVKMLDEDKQSLFNKWRWKYFNRVR